MPSRSPAFDASHYEVPALWLNTTRASARESLRLRTTAEALPSDVASLADLGAGEGDLLRVLAALRPEVWTLGVERSAYALAAHHGVSVRASLTDTPLRRRAVDVVVLCEVLEHLPGEALQLALAEADRISRKYVVVTVPNREDLRRGMVTCAECECSFHRFRHLRSFTPRELRTLHAGWTTLLVMELGPREMSVPRPVVALARRLRLLTPLRPLSECPQCGATPILKPAPDRATPASPARESRLPLARRPWLLAVYEKVDT